MNTETELQFDGWTVNRISGDIARNGNASRLPQQPLRILLELSDHAGTVVTREQLVKALWPAGVIDFDNGLNVAVRKLRVALDDVGDVRRATSRPCRASDTGSSGRAARKPEPAIEAILKLPPARADCARAHAGGIRTRDRGRLVVDARFEQFESRGS